MGNLNLGLKVANLDKLPTENLSSPVYPGSKEGRYHSGLAQSSISPGGDDDGQPGEHHGYSQPFRVASPTRTALRLFRPPGYTRLNETAVRSSLNRSLPEPPLGSVQDLPDLLPVPYTSESVGRQPSAGRTSHSPTYSGARLHPTPPDVSEEGSLDSTTSHR